MTLSFSFGSVGLPFELTIVAITRLSVIYLVVVANEKRAMRLVGGCFVCRKGCPREGTRLKIDVIGINAMWGVRANRKKWRRTWQIETRELASG